MDMIGTGTNYATAQIKNSKASGQGRLKVLATIDGKLTDMLKVFKNVMGTWQWQYCNIK